MFFKKQTTEAERVGPTGMPGTNSSNLMPFDREITDTEIVDFLARRRDLTITFSAAPAAWGILSKIRPEFGAWYHSHGLREALQDFIRWHGHAPSAVSFQNLVPNTKEQQERYEHYWPTR